MTERLNDQLANLFNTRLNRRTLVLGAGAVAMSGLLVACAEDDDDEEDIAVAEPEDDDAVEEEPEPDEDDGPDDDEPDDDEPDDDDTEPDDVDPDDITPVGDRPDELVISWGADQFDDFGLDPVRHSGRVAESMLRHIYEPLVRFEPDFSTIVPALATDWEQVDDLTWQFTLREGVEFHNGEPFNAEAVQYSILRPLQEETIGQMAASRYGTIDDVEIVDEYTVNIITNVPDGSLLGRLAAGFHTNIMAPEWAAQGQDVVSREANGTGPYRLVSWSPNEDLVLEANPDYWDGPPEIENVRLTVIPEDSTRVAALRTGEIHVAFGIPPEQIATVDAEESIRTATTEANRSAYYYITVDVEPYDDYRVRQAINYAANVDGVLEAVLGGMGVRLATTVPPFATGFNPDLEPYPHDPERAQELLAEAGYPDGIDLDIWYREGRIPKDREFAEAMCTEMGQANIRCTPHLIEPALLTEMQRNRETPGLVFASWGNAYSDAMDSIDPIFGCGEALARDDWTRPYGCNEELEAILEAALTETDQEARNEHLREAQRYLYEDAAALFQYLTVDIYGLNNWVLWQPRPDQMIWAHEMRWNQ